ncbi:ATP-dependent DNA ligase [Candidatus Woesearchaeota archaeon]|nr:ATP-dependent DNA ligase [Candidatus Woesearchaeota archaeon]
MKFSKLAGVFEKLEKVSSGNKMRGILAGFFKKVPGKEIAIAAYFTTGRIASQYEDIVINLAEKMVIKSIAEASGRPEKDVNEVYKDKGDIGLVAEKFCSNGGNLSLKDVFKSLRKIAEMSGKGSQGGKITALADLLKKASGIEARYVARLVLGTLRLGVGDMTVLDALSIAFTGSKEAKKDLEHAYNICPDIGEMAEIIAGRGVKGIKKINVRLGRPVRMMLAQRVKKIKAIKEKIPGKIDVEEKYDGERMQIHVDGKKIRIFSRRMDDITSQFPDVVEQVRKNIKSKKCVIEGECVAVDKKGNMLPFQKLMQRRRKYDVEEYVRKIPVCLYLFDLLYLKGESYIRKGLPDRHKALKSIVKDTRHLKFVKRIITEEIDELEDFFNKSVSRGGEGIIAKDYSEDSIYRAGTRGWLWIKWKQEYQKMADTFDLVVVGAYAGRGKRAGTYGALLCAVYNREKDEFDTFCKLGSGFTDKQLEELPKKLKKFKIKKKHARVNIKKSMKPDVYFTPSVVVEVLGAEITRSPSHSAGEDLALRFPRFRNYRPDKSPEQATTVKEVTQMFKKK